MKTDTVIHIKANIDDISGEKHGYLMEELLNLGVLDVNFSPLMMKKNRPAVLLSVIVKEDLAREVIDLLMNEGASLGLRVKEETRVIADRRFTSLVISGVKVKIKESYWNERLVNYKVEYEDCKILAKELTISFDKAREMIINKYLKKRK
ncbi:MAG: nickel insertion protein [Clostridia bacterium]